jgi:hypothetical protein
MMIKLRNYLDPKKFTKSNEFGKLPNYFEIGKVVDGGDNFK